MFKMTIAFATAWLLLLSPVFAQTSATPTGKSDMKSDGMMKKSDGMKKHHMKKKHHSM